MKHRRLLHAWLLILAASCAGSSSYERERDAYRRDGDGCVTTLSPRARDGRPVVLTRCTFPAHADARAAHAGRFAGAADARDPWLMQSGGERGLAQLSRAGTPLDAIRDQDIRATAEFRSYMDAHNVWQWGDRVSDAEALAACRLMLADLRAGYRVNWQSQARAYLVRARRAMPAAQPGGASRTAAGPGDHAQVAATPMAAAARAQTPDEAGGGTAQKKEIRVVLDEGWKIREDLRRRGGGGGVLDRLDDVLDIAEAQIDALSVLLSGTTIVITGVVVGGTLVEFVLVADGVAPGSMALALELAEPLLEDLAGNLRELHAIAEEHGAIVDSDAALSRRTAEERIAYRRLVHTPMERIAQRDLERIHELQRRGGLLPETLRPGSAAHKAERWAEYRKGGGEWPFERWSTTYDQNMVRSSRAHAVADRVHKDIGWGEREVRVETFDGERRVLDIADSEHSRGIEVKSGYVTYTADVASELRRDAKLVDEGWRITWHVEGRFSEPLRKSLRAVGIAISETRPNTPIKDLRP